MPIHKPHLPETADDPAQSERFIDMAREVETDESQEALERAFNLVIQAAPDPETHTGIGPRASPTRRKKSSASRKKLG